jgi:hypothetical protein
MVDTPNLDRETSVRRLFRQYGYEVVSIRHSGHWQVKARRNGGPVQHFTVSTSPSNRHARQKLVASLKRGYSHWHQGG